MCGPEFGPEFQGCFICRALYSFKSSGAAWHNTLAGTLSDLSLTSSLADPDVWMHPALRTNGRTYYEYIFVYVDDILVLSE
jgi:hypothetical protein